MNTNVHSICLRGTLLGAVWLLMGPFTVAQVGRVNMRGVVTDSLSGLPVPFASVHGETPGVATVADIDGRFSLKNLVPGSRIKVASVGYQPCVLFVSDSAVQQSVFIPLSPTVVGLNELVVRPKRYSRKENPAVELIRKVIDRKMQNRMQRDENSRYELYEKLTLYWDNFDPESKYLKKHFDFIQNHLDTSIFTGRQTLALSIREKLTNIRYDESGVRKKDIIAERAEGVEATFNDGSMDAFLAEVFKEVDIYDDNIALLLNKFVSPTSSTLATAYYKFYIQDTVFLDNSRCVNLAFYPFMPESFSFSGNLYIAIDENFGIKRANLSIPRHLNINFLENLRIVQHFRRRENGIWMNSREEVYADFKLNDWLTKVYAHQVRSYRHVDAQSLLEEESRVEVSDEFWQNRRHLALKKNEDDIPKLMAQFQRVSIYRLLEKLLEVSVTGYVKTANERITKSKIDFGSVYTLYGYNPIEGHRLRFGLMSTAHWSSKVFFSGYLAYGTQDRRWKYTATTAYALAKRRNYLSEFPRNDLSFAVSYDLYSLGLQMNDENKDNLFVALGTAGIANRSYQNRYKLTYTRDWTSGFGISAWWQHIKDTPAGTLEYHRRIANDTHVEVSGFSLSKFGLEMVYMPGMAHFGSGRTGKNSKVNFVNDNMRLYLRHEYAYKGGALGGDYVYAQTQLGISDRFWLSSFGHIDAYLSAGKVWHSVPFPLLPAPEVNPSLFMMKRRFHLMQPFEFVADEYVTLHTSYFLKGWILNRIPLIKKLKLREVLTFSGYYGNLTAKNNPDETVGLFRFPHSAHPIFGGIYMEGSVGVENIFNVFRIDYFRRFTHLDFPGARRNGIRLGVRFAF